MTGSPLKLRVLYCEDDADTREMMRLVFEAGGFEAICAENPADCLRLAKEQRFDAYVLDNGMPLIPWRTLWGQIRAFDPHTPVIFFSASAYQKNKEKASAAGAQAYITNTDAMEEVLRTIRNAVTVVRGGYEIANLQATDAEN